MAIDLPELGRVGDRQNASLAGVAPHPDESGKAHGTNGLGGPVQMGSRDRLASSLASSGDSSLAKNVSRRSGGMS